jgi:hypothetical protein
MSGSGFISANGGTGHYFDKDLRFYMDIQELEVEDLVDALPYIFTRKMNMKERLSRSEASLYPTTLIGSNMEIPFDIFKYFLGVEVQEQYL